MTNRPYKYYRIQLSEQARKGLDEMLSYRLFIPSTPTLVQHHQLSIFLRVIADANVQWEDARPTHIRMLDEDAERWNLARVWNTGESHHPKWGVRLPVPYLENLAASHEIRTFKTQLPLIRGARLTRPRMAPPQTPGAVCSAVIEAIGLRWLRPTTQIPIRKIVYGEGLRHVVYVQPEMGE